MISEAHARSRDEVLRELSTDQSRGLSEEEVEQRRREHGANRLRQAERRSVWRILVNQVESIVVLLLAAAGVAALAFGQFVESVAIGAVVLVNGAIGFVSEWRAVRSMEALRTDERPVRVRRGGAERQVSDAELVPGDVVLLSSGDVVPADLRILEAEVLRVEEAALTGESVPVLKRDEPVDGEAPLAERSSMLFKGTAIAEGETEAVVVATGMATELGRIAELAETSEAAATPLQRKLDRLGSRLAWITLAIAALVAGIGLLSGQPTILMIETAVALGVAAIPEGLPIVTTIALARGMRLMAKRNALINRLPAVETLGATQVIFTDKTGTLTENRMALRRLVTSQGARELDDDRDSSTADELDGVEARAIEVGVLCSNASLGEGGDDDDTGDPTEIALLRAGARFGLRRAELLDEKAEEREESFDPDVMMMATYHRSAEGLEVAVKGAPRAVLEVCSTEATGADSGAAMGEGKRQRWIQEVESLAADGLRVLAVADKRVRSVDADPYQDLRFLGLLCLVDPPRDDVEKAMQACRGAGIRVVMVTGDQPATGRAVAEQVGLLAEDGAAMRGRELGDADEVSGEKKEKVLETQVFARVTPEQKLDLIQLFQEEGAVVAMTGDGVNDAPALKKADIGIAMGKRGTDAARQVSDMILQDDAFGSIVAAVRQGRVIFANIRKSVVFMLCTNIAEIVAVAAASAASAPLPLRPLQILYLNVVTDVFPALALGVGEGDPRVMERPPRPSREAVLTRQHWTVILGWSVVIAICVLASLALAIHWLGLSGNAAVTISFLTLAFGKLWFVYNLRDPGSPPLDNDIVRNPYIWAAVGLCIGLLLAAIHLPGLTTVLETRAPDLSGWLLVLGASLVPLLLDQLRRALSSGGGAVAGAAHVPTER